MIYERDFTLTTDERNTLLFLTGGLKVFTTDILSPPEIHNIYEYFGNLLDLKERIIKVIIFKDHVTLKLFKGE